MGSLLRTAKKHKKSRRLGKPEVMAREEYGELEVDVKIEMIRSLIPLGLMHVHELLDDEVKELAGERYARKDELERGRRHGTNPGTVGLAGQRVVPSILFIRGHQLATSLEGRDESKNKRRNHVGMVPVDRRPIKFGARMNK